MATSIHCKTEVKPRIRVNKSWVAYRDVQNWDKTREYGRRLGKCSERFRKYSEVIWVQNILENFGHLPTGEISGDNAG